MTELKTLKDFICMDCVKKADTLNNCANLVEKTTEHFLSTHQLRQEALKRIKSDTKTIEAGPNEFKNKWKEWIEFFNLTEEDLK